MARLRGRSRRRALQGRDAAAWKTTTFTGGLRRTGMGAPMVLDGAMDDGFEGIDRHMLSIYGASRKPTAGPMRAMDPPKKSHPKLEG